MILPYKNEEYKVDRTAFEQVAKDLESGILLNFAMMGAIFGQPFWETLTICLMETRKAGIKTKENYDNKM